MQRKLKSLGALKPPLLVLLFRRICGVVVGVMLAAMPLCATSNSVAVLTHHNDPTRTGAKLLETRLNIHNANTNHADDAQNVNHELWNSEQLARRDSFGNFAKFCPPTVANGKVYLATFSKKLCVYGILTERTK